MESDIIKDDFVETETFDLGTLEINKTCAKTFTFREVSKVDMEMKVQYCTAPTDMRYSTELCQEEEKFILERKDFVFESMKTFLGERGPQTIDEVPNVAILGSGGGFRAMVSLSGVFCALKDMHVLDCAMYTAGLSGSAWYLSTLYSHPEWPHLHPRVIRDTLRDNISDNWMWLMFTPSWMYRHLKIIVEKKQRGQPVSFTDLFGYLVGDTILKDRDEMPLLSEQQQKIESAVVPFPLYCCVHVKKDVPAKKYCEWLEFSPYEIGVARYGTFMKTEYFGSKFFCGKLVGPYPEPPLHYLQGIWGSAFTIVLHRVLHEAKLPSDTIDDMSNPGDLREELREMIDGKDDDDDDDSDSDNEDDDDVTDNNNTSGETKEKDNDDEGFFGRFFENLVDKLAVLKTRTGRAGLVHNFLRGLQILTAPFLSGEAEDETDAADELALTSSHIYLVDSGLVFNSPYPPLLRPERKVDVFISFDFSARKRDVEFPFEELLLAEEWAKKNKLKFPPIKAEQKYKKHGMKEVYVFRHPTDPTCPIVIHFVLANKTFKQQIKPGIPRETKEDKDYANFSLFEDRHNWYSTFNFHYRKEQFNRLADLNEFNTLLGEQTIKDVIAECVQRRRQQRLQSPESEVQS
ncbi:cytosolic phospholipase A2-like [Oculina patagonica]